DCGGIIRSHNALLFPSLDVEVNATEPQCVSLSLAPVDLAQKVAGVGAWLDPIPQRQKTVVVKPCIEMNTSSETVESGIEKCDQKRVLVDELHDSAHDRVAPAVTVVDDLAEISVKRSTAVRWMIPITEPPEHMLNPVGRIKEAVKQPVVE